MVSLGVRPQGARAGGRCAYEAAAVADSSPAREAAAAAAAELVEPDMTIGLGSGRAVWALTERLPSGMRAVVASELTREVALARGIEVLELDGAFELDLALDGADEIDGWLGLIKGGGGALLREKIVISAARRFVVVAEASKKVEPEQRLRLPVEVVRFGWKDTRRRLSSLLPDAELRRRDDGLEPYITDESHYILDCAIPASMDPAGLATLAIDLRALPGVVEHGLFLDMADLALLGHDDGTVERLSAAEPAQRPATRPGRRRRPDTSRTPSLPP
jgi:ribose 5-phosphate isomerase A